MQLKAGALVCAAAGRQIFEIGATRGERQRFPRRNDRHLREHECLADLAEGDAFRCLMQRGEAVILEDFAELRKVGLTHPLMDEIENKFTTGG